MKDDARAPQVLAQGRGQAAVAQALEAADT